MSWQEDAQDEMWAAAMPADDGPRLPYVCRCGQLSGDARVCDACRAQERKLQGETVRLFEPAPTQLAGQGFWTPDQLRAAAGDTPGF